MLRTYTFNSNNKGKNLLVLGAIHGNETCGVEASKKIIDKINKGELEIKNGSVTFIPICNPIAYKKNERYHEANLNRVIKKHGNPSVYEEKVANFLTSFIEKSDYLLDLHSMHTNDQPFVFQDYKGDKLRKFAKAQGVEYVFVGWPEIYSDNGVLKDYTTEAYANDVNTIAVTVECGGHGTKESTDIAEQCIINSLEHLDIISTQNKELKTDKELTFIQMEKVIYKKFEGRLNGNKRHMDSIKKGEIIGMYDNGENIISEKDCYLILPNHNCNLNEEWFYLGRKL